MIFVTGPLFSGKEEYICRALGWSHADFEEKAKRDVQELVRNIQTGTKAEEKSGIEHAESMDDKVSEGKALLSLADTLSRYEVVISTEVGGGVVPADAEERAFRESAGRLSCLLAERADVVVRVCCGLPQFLKGGPL